MIHFIRPYWFIALLPMLLLCWRLSKLNVVNNWRKVCDEHLLPYLLLEPTETFKLPILLLVIGGLMAIVALAGPSWEKAVQPIYRASAGRVFVLNLSPSLSDTIGTAKKIDLVRFKLLDYLQRQQEGMTGLVVYTDEAYTISPLTDDNRTIANFIPALTPSIMPTTSDDTPTGIALAAKLLKQSHLSQGTIVLVTDKITNVSAAKKLAGTLYAEGYRLTLVAVTDKPSADMQKLAAAGHGKLIPITANNHDVDALITDTTVTAMTASPKETEEKGTFWQDDGRWFVLFLLPLALFAFRKGILP